MGCGGSRADAIEPRYYESWTRETESTWLTNTDAEPPPQQLPGGGPESGNPEVGLRETGILEDGKYTQTCVTKSSATSGIATAEKRTQCGMQFTKTVSHTTVSHTTTTASKQQNGFRTAEPKWDSKKKATKETTMNAAKNNRQMNSNRRVTKNCVN